MSKLYAIRQTKFDKYWYDFVEDFTSAELDEHCVSNDFVYVKECQNNLGDLNPAWKDSEIVEIGIIADLEARIETKEKNIRILTKKLEEETNEWIAVRDDKNNVINKQTEKINQLKQQLAEMTEKYNACQEARKLEIEFSQQDKKELIQQLAEKETLIVELEEILERTTWSWNDALNQLSDKEKEIERLREVNLDVPIKQMQFHHNQDKISFAVEQLENVKKLIQEKYGYVDDCDYCVVYEDDVDKIFDNQINVLRNNKDGIH